MTSVTLVFNIFTLVFNIFTFASYAKNDEEVIEWSEQEVLWYIDEPEHAAAEDETSLSLFSAADTSWYDESQIEFEISTAVEFMGFITLANGGNDFVGKKITLQNDITFTEAINPIASFNGELDGAGHTLSEVYIAAATDDNTGLFKILGENADVYDFNISGVIAGSYVAAVAGTNNGTISGVHSLAAVQGNTMSGGICVENNGIISSSSANNSTAISGAGTAMGGICALNTGTIENCENKAVINTDASSTGTPAANAGGIAGQNSGTIMNSFNYSDISGKDYISGIAGKNTKDITGCINTAQISSLSSYVGGIAGSNAEDAEISDSINGGDITCGADVSDTAAGYYVGGITGTSAGNIVDSENAGNVTSAATGAGGIVGAGNGNITGCTNYGAVTAPGSMAGGIIGQSTAGGISLAKNYGTVRAWKYMGGIAGQTKSGSTVDKSGNFGTISATETDFDNTNFAGGIVGANYDTVTNCFNISGNILSKWNCGSIAGYANEDNLIGNSYSIGTLKLVGNNKAAVNTQLIPENDVSLTDGTLLATLNGDGNVWYIYAMNNSPKHEDVCYGDMRLEIPAEMAALKGWDSVYTSVGNDKDTEQPGTLELKGRGNSSWSQAIRDNGPRPYQFKLEKKLNLMGMGGAKTYTLLKSDQIQSTNKTLMDMSIDMGMKYTPQSEFVDVYLNGDYIGMYTLAEKVQINEERVNISDLEEEIEDAETNETSICSK